MAKYIIMPKLGFNMDQGTVVHWLKKEGDTVEEREEVLEIETDKTVIPVEAPCSGILRKILVAEGEVVPVTLPIAIIGDKEEDISQMVEEAYQKLGKVGVKGKKESKEERKINIAIEESQRLEKKKEEVEFKKISPRAQRKAQELGVDVQLVEGNGPEGAVTEKDVISFAQRLAEGAGTNLGGESVQGASVGGRIMKVDVQESFTESVGADRIEEKIPYSGMRKIIGDRLSHSKFTAPHIYFTTSIDMSEVIKLVKRFNEDKENNISINDFIVFVVSRVLAEQPHLNCSLVGEEIIYYKDINLGIAVALEEGLIVPVVKNADQKSLSHLSTEAKKLIESARKRKLSPDDYSGGTFTVSNLGMYKIENFTAIINPPEAAILAVGAIKKVPVVIEEDEVEKIGICPLMRVTLSVDHRLIDGAMAANFLNRLKYYLEFPEGLIL